ncbi:hypothetical protein ACTXT7_014040 [Hymenolepis weldensis]
MSEEKEEEVLSDDQLGLLKGLGRHAINSKSNSDNADETADHHLWYDTSQSGDLCYVGDLDCMKAGPRKKCASCRIVCHTACIPRVAICVFRDRSRYFGFLAMAALTKKKLPWRLIDLSQL